MLFATLAASAGLPRVSPPAEVGATPPETDLLYLQPASGVPASRLAEALRALGVDVVTSDADGARVAVPPGAEPAALAARLAASGLARSVEGDGIVRAAREPDDPRYVEQSRYLDTIGAPQAWARATGADVVIAVIDTGIDLTHPDLASRLFVNRGELANGRDDDGNGCVDDVSGCSFVSPVTADPSCGYTTAPPHAGVQDDEGHGTFVAGIAAAAGNNGRGITGVAWDARLLPVKVLDCTATGRISDAAGGIRYAARLGADVINISFGTLTDSPVLRDAIREAQALGAVVVASAGNDGRRGVTYPARYDDVLSVAASGLQRATGLDYRATATFANFGGGVDFLAPGVRVLSTVPTGLCGRRGWVCGEDGPYAVASGSSFATPVVAGAVAVMLARHPDRSPDLAVRLLLGARGPGATVADARVLDLGAAVEREVFTLGAPGTSRAGGGAVPGPRGD